MLKQIEGEWSKYAKTDAEEWPKYAKTDRRGIVQYKIYFGHPTLNVTYLLGI